ncbi:TIGR00341 family protein [Geobacter sp. AOG2]|uniref:TIGR00341 family protein n=1 Tax=Geobacter sp. AOG2 TaxID=1566347 RepID=UPI001CC4FC2E|nr:TIGR00341 family protein [Geobacter sp. AOG2]GFE60708.1 membrane protein [Geobacter sp. AOG2]
MLRAYLKLMAHNMSTSIDAAVARIEHNAVIKDLTGRADLSGSYLLMIVFSCLVALLGLLTNSVAVVIGAMLISPLMGPIFSAALAFSLGDLQLARKAMKIIIVSILLSVLIAAFFTILSPLKAQTQEIVSRTRPNIYDLLIAVFAGAAGAYALCTRVNYLFVTTGVAVATAVIPPLSVVGYGIGTGQAAIALGGFLLFFTNLVAIVISSVIVFHIFKFRASMVEEARYPVRRRIQILGAVLAFISVPLVYTLVTDVKKVNLTSRVERVLRSKLDRKDHSRMTDFSFQQRGDGLTVAASVNTTRFYNVSTEKRIEGDLKTALKRPVQLDLEQVIVKTGRVEPLNLMPRIPLIAPPPPQAETLATLREKAVNRVKEGCEELRAFVKPYPIVQCGIRFSDQGAPITVVMAIGRDYPFSEEERRWLRVALEKKLGEPLELDLETVPFLPPIGVGEDGKLDEASRKALAVLKQVVENDSEPQIMITAPRSVRQNHALKIRDVAAVKEYLVEVLGIPAAVITHGPDSGSDLRVRVEPVRLPNQRQ